MDGKLRALIERADSPGAVQSIVECYLDVSIDQAASEGRAVLSAAETRREKLLVSTAALEHQYAAPAAPDIVESPDIPGDSKRPTAHEMQWIIITEPVRY